MALLREVQSQQAIYKLKGEADILSIAYQAGVTCVQIMHVRNGKMLGGKVISRICLVMTWGKCWPILLPILFSGSR